jgi:hypothetical protein
LNKSENRWIRVEQEGERGREGSHYVKGEGNGEKGEKRVQGNSPRCPSTTPIIKGVSFKLLYRVII